MILSIQPNYTMKMEAVSDSSQAEQNSTLFIISYFLITFTRMKSCIQRKQPTRTPEEETEDDMKKMMKKNEKKLLKD